MSHRSRSLRLAALSAGVMAACAAVGLSPAASSATAGNSLPTLTLAMTKNTVTVGGSQVSGAVNVVSTVSGEASDNPALIRLATGVTPAQFATVVSKLGNAPFDAIDPYGSIVFGGSATSAGPTSAQVVLTPGTYIAVNNGNGFTPFTITASSAPAALPAPAATVSAIDFAFRVPTTLRDGELVRFENDGYLIHMALYARVPSVLVARRAEALLLAGKVKQAKKLAIGPSGQFMGPMSQGSMQQEVISQPPGVYVVLCAMNAQDGRDHYQLGMFRTIRIVK
jgi:hypothetical protein